MPLANYFTYLLSVMQSKKNGSCRISEMCVAHLGRGYKPTAEVHTFVQGPIMRSSAQTKNKVVAPRSVIDQAQEK